MAVADKQREKGKPRGRPFAKGKSGNPRGRPKTGQAFTDILREIGETYEKKTRQGLILYNQALAQTVWGKALKGQRWACELIYNRLDGKPTQPISGEGLGPIEIIIKHDD